jgi:hypothetical protein
MPVFATPGPISVTVEVYAADLQIVASDRADTVVELRPTNEADESDVRAAEQTRVEHADGTLTIRGPRARGMDLSKKSRSVDLVIELPTGSQLHGFVTAGEVRSSGALGECRFRMSVGHAQLDRTGPLRLTTLGRITVDAVGGDAEVDTGSGRIRLGAVDGGAVVKNSNGETEIGTVAGDLRARSANGSITVDRAGAGVDAKTSNGSIRVGTVARGSVSLRTAAGDLDVGIADGTAAWLDLKTGHGRVRNELADLGRGPAESDETVEVRASTSFGDITVRRS